MKKLLFCLFACLIAFSGAAFAEGLNYHQPGSMLIFPFFSSDVGEDTIISVTNVNRNHEYDLDTGKLLGDVFIHFFYVDGEDCDITNRREYLTPGDLFTTLVTEHNPAMNKGFILVLAEDADTRVPIKWDGIDERGESDYGSGLIGDAIVANGILNFLWTIPAINVKAESEFEMGELLLLTGSIGFGNGYELLPNELFISSFIEQGFLMTESTLILLDPTISNSSIDLDYLFYNNDELEFSQSGDFKCWMMKGLGEIFGAAGSLGGVAATIPTGWVTIQTDTEKPEPLLGMLIQAIANDDHSSARLLHQIGADAEGYIEF